MATNERFIKQFSEWLNGRHDRRPMMPKDLAEAIGISRTTVYRYVNAEARPDFDKAIALAKFFGENTDYVLEHAGHRTHRPGRSIENPRSEVIAKIEALNWNTYRNTLLIANLEVWQQEDRSRVAATKRLRDTPEPPPTPQPAHPHPAGPQSGPDVAAVGAAHVGRSNSAPRRPSSIR